MSSNYTSAGSIIKKIPGKLEKIKSEYVNREDFVNSLRSKTKTELVELLERQEKLLKNKSRLEKLPDKGNKIISLRDEILKQLEEKNKSDNLCSLVSNLSIKETKDALDALEWTGGCNPGFRKNRIELENLPDEDDTDPLHLLATHSGTVVSNKKQIREEKEEPLITPEDVKEAEECLVLADKNIDNTFRVSSSQSPAKNLSPNAESAESTTVNGHSYNGEVLLDVSARKLCTKFDSENVNRKEVAFHTNRPVRNSVEIKPEIKNKHRDISAAVIPRPVCSRVQNVSLSESLILQQEHKTRLKEIQLQHAMDRLTEKVQHMKIPLSNAMDYEEPEENVSQQEMDTESTSED